jgi:glutaredoxin-related protein
MLNTLERKQSNVSIRTVLIGSTAIATAILPVVNQDMIHVNLNKSDDSILRFISSHQDSISYENMQSTQAYSIPSISEEEPIIQLRTVGSIRIKIGKKQKLDFSGIID